MTAQVDEMKEVFDELDDMDLSQPDSASQESFKPSSSEPSLSQSSSHSEEVHYQNPNIVTYW